MTLPVRSGTVAFSPRARLLKLIGAELISDDVVAITELVKNAYDAGASRVTISFRGVVASGGEITVADDGSGMDLDTVLGVWMEPGATSKIEASRRTRGRRRVLGEKGVGRFACDKLGRHLELVSRRAGDDDEVCAVFDWDRFESASDTLASIRSQWVIRPATVIGRNGTVLRISGLRAAWTERMFLRLATRLSRLCSPFRELDDFGIILESDEFPHYAGELRAEFLEQAPYRVDAVFDGERFVAISLGGESATSESWPETRPPGSGPVRVRVFAFDLETEALARIGPRAEVRAWLREWSGISVYRDGFRVWPYGEPHDDWLRLDQRRVNNPVERLSNNQVVGFVEISRDRNPELRDQTNREGLLHNEAFADLRRLLYMVLERLEAARQAVRHPFSSQVRRQKPVAGRHSNGHTVHTRIPPGHLQGWSELAAAGQAAALVPRTLRPLVADVRDHLVRLRGAMNGNGGPASRRALGRLEELVVQLGERLDSVVEMHPQIVTSRRTIDVGAELERARVLLLPLLEASGVRMSIALRGARLLRAEIRSETFHYLICILARNSLEWLQGRRHRRIRVIARPRGDRCEVILADTGPGIAPRIAGRVFEPLFSARDGGRGMGLAIARAIVELHRGDITVVHDRRRRGAAFRILLPRKRARSTVPTR
jgi:signal transduction histidine kinase